MLGVHYDSKNTETGVLTQWPKDGLRIVWHEKLGTGYGNGVAALGRWLQFDRHGNVERLSCYEAQTGKFLWKWEASVVYQDAYGYNDGPRSSPIVDGRYVYVYGVAGRIACVDIETGKELCREISPATTASYQTFSGLVPVPWFTTTCSSPWSAEVPNEVSFPVCNDQ